MRSRIEIGLTDGRTVSGWADECYRGGPQNPLGDAELAAKVHSYRDGVLDDAAQNRLIAGAWGILDSGDATELARLIQSGG